MRGPLVVSGMMLLAAFVVGCGPGLQGRGVFVPVVEKPADSAWPFTLPASAPEAKEPKKGGPMILIYARIMAAHPDELGQAGIACDKPLSILPSLESLKTLDGLLRARKAQLLSAPRIVAVPGQPATVSVTRAYSYVGDYVQKKPKADGAAAWAPVLHTVHCGLILTVRAELADNQVVFTAVDPRMASAFGVRECKSRIGGAGKEGMALDWEEPVFLASEGALPANEKVALKPGASLALPLKDTVRVAVSEVRKRLDQPVQAKTPGGLKALSGADKRGFPLPGRTVLVLTARAVESGDDAPEPKAPSAKPAP